MKYSTEPNTIKPLYNHKMSQQTPQYTPNIRFKLLHYLCPCWLKWLFWISPSNGFLMNITRSVTRLIWCACVCLRYSMSLIDKCRHNLAIVVFKTRGHPSCLAEATQCLALSHLALSCMPQNEPHPYRLITIGNTGCNWFAQCNLRNII